MSTAKDPCWDGYTAYGTKQKNGKTVPNCVPDKPKKTKKKDIQEDSVTTTANIPVRNMPAAGEGQKKKKKLLDEPFYVQALTESLEEELLESLPIMKENELRLIHKYKLGV